jgi:prevent-host-death family protein
MKRGGEPKDVETVSVTELGQRPGDVLNRVHYGKIPIVVTRRGKPAVLMLPIIGLLDEKTRPLDLVKAWLTEQEHGA